MILFNRQPIGSYGQQVIAAAVHRVARLTALELANDSEDVASEFMDQYRIEPIQLIREARYSPNGFEDASVVIPVGPSNNRRVAGKRLSQHFPFRGDPELFHCRSNPFHRGGIPPTGVIHGDELVVTWEGPNSYDPAEVNAFFEGVVDSIVRVIDTLRENVQGINNEMFQDIQAALSQRRQQIEKDRSTEDLLAIPVGRRQDPSEILRLEVSPKRVRPAPTPTPSSTTAPARGAEISAEDYGAILEVIGSVRSAIERFPNTFAGMGEEVLREILLVILNNQFGPSAGELFSRVGKTDIAILGSERPVFIAECKIWKSLPEFERAINQLLGYLTWRDNKAAIILFVRNKRVSSVIEKATNALSVHSQLIRQASDIGGAPSWIYHQPMDPDREVRIAFVEVAIPRVVNAVLKDSS